MKSSSKTAIVVPVYNEAQVVGEVITELSKHYSKVICINDKSYDKSKEEIMKTKAVLVNHEFNMGAGAATQTGIEYALQDADIENIVTFDGDGQHQVKDIAPLVEYLQKNKLDVVFGSRFLGSVENIKGVKSVFLKLVKYYNRHTTKVNLTDPHIGLRVFNRKFAQSLDITLHGFAHASEIVDHIYRGGYKYGEYPVTVVYTEHSLKKGQPMLNAINIIFDLFINRYTKK